MQAKRRAQEDPGCLCVCVCVCQHMYMQRKIEAMEDVVPYVHVDVHVHKNRILILSRYFDF